VSLTRENRWSQGDSNPQPLACKVAENASLSVLRAWPAANNRIHHRQVAVLLLQFAAAGSRRERASREEGAKTLVRFPSLPSAGRQRSDDAARRRLQAWQPSMNPGEPLRMRLKLRLALRPDWRDRCLRKPSSRARSLTLFAEWRSGPR
jgi:hypothetical protein